MSRINRKHENECAQLAGALVAYALGVKSEMIFKSVRGSDAACFARQVAIYLTHTAFGFQLSRVARAFDRNPSTIAHACHVIEDRRDDPDFDTWLEQLEAGLVSIAPLIANSSRDAA